MIAMASVLAAVFGLVIGSFLNVVVYRVPAGISVSRPASSCPTCKSEIRAFDNIPVVSWLALGGRCRSCKTSISARYPIVESLTGVFFVIVVVSFLAQAPETLASAAVAARLLRVAAFLYLAAISVALGIIDTEHKRLPDRIVLPSYGVAVALLTASSALANDWADLGRACVGLGILGAFYFAVAFAYPAGMGLGDVKLAGLLGLYLGYLGWGPLIVGGFSAFLLGGLFSIVLIALKRIGRKGGIPFGPWMLVGAWVGVFAGRAVWHGYLSLIGLAS
ncbi:A24 family peptidase [Frondihabitans peucedani]|uniref:A24 family peptidase n=2 Tax=Frondihabitans peucedani TaxID=598626 RepID=A0ABP8E2L4_9MICO